MSSLMNKIRFSRAVAAVSLAAFVAAWSPTAVFSQEGGVARDQQPTQQPAQQQQPAQPQNSIIQPLALSPPVTRQRVGVRENEVQALALQDAIVLALQNNLDIEQFRQGVQIADRSLYALRGVYDIVSS